MGHEGISILVILFLNGLSEIQSLDENFLKNYITYFQHVYYNNSYADLSVKCRNSINGSKFLETKSKWVIRLSSFSRLSRFSKRSKIY